jgi:site-specific DNA recombinase
MGYRTNTGKKFSHTTIGRLLRDPAAKGMRRANYSTGDGTNIVMKPESEWIMLPCEPIVTEELWEECNRILDEQEKRKTPSSKKALHLLAGLVHCECGKKMYIYHTAPVYKCRQCKRKIDVEDIDTIFHEQLKDFFLTETDFKSAEQEKGIEIAEKETLLENSRTELAKLKKKLQEMVTSDLKEKCQRSDSESYMHPLKNRCSK